MGTVRCIFLICRISPFVQSELVINIDDLETLDAGRIEAEATLVDKIVREGNCEGAKEEVRTYEYFIQEKDDLEWVVNGTNVGMTIHLRPDLNCLDQEDESLITILKTEYLDPPSTEPYNTSMIPSAGPASYSTNQEEIFLDRFVFKGQ